MKIYNDTLSVRLPSKWKSFMKKKEINLSEQVRDFIKRELTKRGMKNE